jgi:magnesium transporter
VDSFAPPINRIERETSTIEDQVFNARPNDIQEFSRKIGTARKNIMSLMRLLGGKADVLRAFTKRCNEDYNVTPRMDIGLFLSDIQDHVVTMINNLSHFEKILAHSHSNYLNQLSIDNIGQGNRVNEFLRHVTIVTTVILAMTVISGLFGMNVPIPWQDVDNVNAFLGIASAVTLFALICLLAARGRRFI